ncbi:MULTISPECIES: DUF1659 domain-containing protein [Clostridium]|jgi:hypothetical protein|uniref:DUF1659 domain-containing protein n=2 Tax=Clostridium TaxID=1485 RepID=A0A512TNY0_CLOBU|nr:MULTISPECIES: DUF1659 domain-containing protein [Clostridium]NAS17506.1 DUF1659 domain-containing protein [Clostridium butyricum]NOW22694.1 hypothetical protein [Clostridium butyricum]OOP74276.1 hypothetical protein CBEIBR21_07215 [Clostridium beijerinckii]GEQ21771.1 hypothetical protein CBU02nite_22770 [Clostridium butyricum]
MAATKVISTTSLSIEVQSGTDAAGDATYSKKTFSNVKTDAAAQNIYEVADAIKNVLEASTRDVFVNETSTLVNA